MTSAPATFDLYGSVRSDIDALRSEIEGALGIEFEPRSSAYLGDYYRCEELGRVRGESFVLQSNVDEFDPEPDLFERDFPDCAVLLYVSYSTRSDGIRDRLAALSSLRFLRRTIV